MYRKSNYRRVAGEGGDVSVWLKLGFRYLHLGMLTAMVWTGTELKGEDNGTLPATGETRILSLEIIKAVAEKVPKYAPPAPPKTTLEPLPDESKDSSPGVFHLPKLTVKERPSTLPPTFDLLTRKERLELAFKKYPGLRIGNFFGMNNEIALAMLKEERALEQKTALTDTVRRTTRDDSPESKRLLRLINDATQRPNNDWATSGGPMK
ncbi:MAG TPA: hypothetical protein VGM64_04880 [Lacunisphaera sp.]|jgi:hypothetical protein